MDILYIFTLTHMKLENSLKKTICLTITGHRLRNYSIKFYFRRARFESLRPFPLT